MTQRHAENGHAENGHSAADVEVANARAGGRIGGDEYSFTGKDAALLEALTKVDLPEPVQQLQQGESSRDHILSYLDDAELNYRRFQILNGKEIMVASHPPRESIWQGDIRKAVFDEGRENLDDNVPLLHGIREGTDAAYARTARSRDGWQQKILAEQTEERRVVEERPEDSGGWLSKLVGR